jgi:pyrimidine operon attenuation protein/uracil phosphoribosyltransferase
MRRPWIRAPRTAWSKRRVLADEAAVGRMLRRLASEIVEKAGGAPATWHSVGIRTGGLHLAERLCALIEAIEGRRPPAGAVDITLYRDDVSAACRGRRSARPSCPSTSPGWWWCWWTTSCSPGARAGRARRA